MARVIYTGPLNPVIFARAKKEAEKAERINGYTPRVIKTPVHTVVYSKTGQEVKAVVMDMLAPITFSIPGSAIPVRPSFLHLHPDLPEKVYGRENNVIASGYTTRWGGVSDRIGENYLGQALGGDFRAAGLWLRYDESSYISDSLVYHSVDADAIPTAINMYWDMAGGQAPLNPRPTIFEIKISNTGYAQTGSVQIANTYHNSFSVSSMNGSYSIELGPETGQYNYAGQSSSELYSLSFMSTVFGSFLGVDIRKCNFRGEITALNASVSSASVSTNFSFLRQLYVGVGDIHANGRGNKTSTIRSTSFDQKNHVVIADGSVCFPALESVIESSITVSPAHEYSPTCFYETSCSVKLNSCISVNLSSEYYLSHETVNSRYETSGAQNMGVDAGPHRRIVPGMELNTSTNFNKYVFAAGSAVDGSFIGVMIRAKIYEEYSRVNWVSGQSLLAGDPPHNIVRTQYGAGSVFAKSHLAYYFDIFRGEYLGEDTPFMEPPAATTDGICLPHAWFFVRGNETRETDFYPNNHNRLSIVIYPQGRHEFSVDEAEIVSVELDHTPRFVVKPGGSIAFNMQAIFDGDPLVPYVVNGLVEERDEDGEPTGFYLAADGAVEGVFKANYQLETYKLSPRQSLDAYRLITVETTTERKYGVQATFEVFGNSVRVQPGPPSITLECINTSVLAGQTTVFYVTATHIAMGSQLRYEIKRAGAVVSAGYLTIAGGGAGYVDYVAPFTVRPNGESPQRYVLTNPLTGAAAPSVQEFEFSIIHDQAPPPETFIVRYSQESYARASDRPAPLQMPPMFFMGAVVSVDSSDQFYASNTQQTLINRLYYSLKTKKVYALFWDGQSCEVSSILRQNPDTGQYEYNPDWKEAPFDYPPAVDPYNIKGTLEPYVYAYMDYENNRNNGA